MTRARIVALLALALLAPLALAQEPVEPTPSPRIEIGPVSVDYALVLGEDGVVHVDETVQMVLDVRVLDNGTYDVSALPQGVLLKPGARAPTLANLSAAGSPGTLTLSFQAPGEPAERHTFAADVWVHVWDGPNLTQVANGTVSITTSVLAPAPPAPPGALPPSLWLLVAALVLVVGAGAVLATRRRRQVRVAPRSRALQELAVEEREERVRPRERAEVEAERQAFERREAERLETREQMILEAKRQDLLRSIELARERHERGEISAFQFQKLREKKEQALADLERQGGS